MDTFTYHGRELPLFCHLYNLTWFNERCVEIAVVNDWLERYWVGGDRGLIEVGNVLGHYGPDRADLVVDQYEAAAWHQTVKVHNRDLFELTSPPYGADCIVSISTVEHVGTDYPSEHNTLDAINHLRSLLLPGGDMIITAPTGISHVLDTAILEGTTGAALSTTLTKHGPGDWRQDDAPSVSPYGQVDQWAQTVWIGEFGPLDA